MKPENVMIARVNPIWVKIIDFGVSKSGVGTSLNTSLGTPGYSAPEVVFKVDTYTGSDSKAYTNAVDMWGLGCLVHVILTSGIPFSKKAHPNAQESGFEPILTPGIDMVAFYKFYNSFDGTSEYPPGVLDESLTGEERDFLQQLLVPVANRMTAAEALKHPWLAVISCSDLSRYLETLKTLVQEKKSDLDLGEYLQTKPVAESGLRGGNIARKFEQFMIDICGVMEEGKILKEKE